MSNEKKLTTASGRPFVEKEDSLSVGRRGPLLLEDYVLHESMAHFNRERIPERVVHAKGSGAFGTFTVTNDITKYTRAKIFSEVGKKTDMLARFSTVGGEKGSADSDRDPRGFALKFYTEEGNWDLVGNNTPVFFIKDPKKFADFIHTQKRHPFTNMKSQTMRWDYWSLNPESLHQVLILMSDRGTPYGFRHMNGYGSHTFSMINDKDERFYVKFHFKTDQGIKNFTDEESVKMAGENPDFAQQDLLENIENGNFPTWTLKIQVMPEEEAKDYKWNPFDLTKVWPHDDYPLIEVGKMELNKNADNYFAQIEQSAFAPAHIVDGIGYSPDKMLQGRLLSYPDAHRYRLGANYEQIPVNRCPYMVNNYQRDGFMRVDGNGGRSENYYPNSFDDITVDEKYKLKAPRVTDTEAEWFDRNAAEAGDNDHYTQPGNLYRIMSDEAKSNLVSNTVGSMSQIEGEKKDEIIMRQLCHWFRADPELGGRIASGLGVQINMEEFAR
ncbi:catalase [Zunongwangia pacifica]|uniref:catalase n=1 Tax=Zunongwangia pacifica TaxID=2911062 RepID=A0A9X1ZPE1_9FLAO|nr:catalase [Zunongwangia pacifica]MCL6217656.1 catalase [Zunongwangia pacifica]